MQKIFLSLLLALSSLSLSTSSYAQKLENTFGEWSVFTLSQKGEKLCYISSSPINKTGNYKKRGEPYLLVTHRDKNVDEVSTSSGYPYKINSDVDVKIDGKRHYKFFTSNEAPRVAWARTTEDDRAAVKNMIRGLKISIRGRSRLNTYSEDTYSLKGFTKAYQQMKALCK